jgi:hypothetical protein
MALTERLQVLITAAGGGAITEFNKVGKAAQDAYGKTTKAQETAGKSAGRLDGLLQQVGISGSAALGAGVAAGAAIAAEKLAKFGIEGVRAYANYGAEVAKVGRVTGATSQDASRLVAIFHALGIDSDQAATALFRLAKNVGENSSKLQGFGLQIAKNKDGTTNLTATLLNVGDAYKRTQDPAQRAALAFAVFGKQAQTLGPLLSRSREELQEFAATAARRGLVFSDADVAKAREFNIASRELHESISALQIELGKELLPVLAGIVHGLTVVADKVNSVSQHAGGLANVVGALANNVIPGAGIVLKKLSDDAEKSAKANSEAAREALGAGAAFDEEAGGALAAQQAVAQNTNTVLSFAHAQLAVQQANQAVTAAQHQLNEARAGGVNRARDMAAAEKDVRRAQEQVADAVRSIADAEHALDVARRGVDPRDLASAQLDVKDAQFEVADAQQALIDVGKEGVFNLEDYQKAQLRVERATISLSRAQEEAGKLQEDANNKIAGAQRTLEDAQRRAADAADQLADAQARQRGAAKPADIDAVANAQLGLQAAQLGVLDATERSNEAYSQFFQIVSQGAGPLADLQGTLAALAGLGFTIPAGLIGTVLPEQDVVGRGPLGPVRRRAAGGPIDGAALVGEHGPELLVGKGTIIPNGMFGGGDIHLTVNGAPGQDVRTLAMLVRDELLKLKRRNVSASLS